MILVERLVVSCRYVHYPVVLSSGKVVEKKVDRIDLIPVLYHFVMAMRSGAFTSATYPANYITTLHPLPYPRFHFKHMPIERFIPIPMVYNSMIAVTACIKISFWDRTVARSIDWR